MAVYGGVYGSERPIPSEIAFFASVDWLLDRFGTTTNILSDSYVVCIMDHLYGDGSGRRELREQKHVEMAGEPAAHASTSPSTPHSDALVEAACSSPRLRREHHVHEAVSHV